MNTTIDALANLTDIPLTPFRIATNALPSFSYVQVPHTKLKAEHQALVLFHIVKIGLAYWEGWRDGKRNGKEEQSSEEKDRAEEQRKKRVKRRSKIFGRGKYTVVFQ